MENETTVTTPELPAKVEDMDRLRFLLSGERLARLDAQIELLQTQRVKLAEQQKHAASDLRAKYQLGDQDTFDSETGVIKRA